MTLAQQLITVGLCVAATMTTRFVPFLVFSGDRPLPRWVEYLGRTLPFAIFALLVVYCLKDVSLADGSHGVPEALALLLIMALHRWKGNMLISIAGGTVFYMLLVQLVF